MTAREPGAKDVLTYGGTLRPALDRLLREQRGAEHERGIGRVRAGGDRGDQHVAVRQVHEGVRQLLLENLLDPRGRRAVVDHLGLGPGVRVFRRRRGCGDRCWFLVAAAHERCVRRGLDDADPGGITPFDGVGILAVSPFGGRLDQQLREPLFRSWRSMRSCGRLGPETLGRTVARSSSMSVL